MTAPIAPAWISAAQVPEYCGLSSRKLQQLANDGEVERRYVGSKPLYRTASIDDYITRQAQHRADTK